MEWIANPTVGDWLRERLDPRPGTMHAAVPRGFPAYARVFHRGFTRSLPGRAVPTPEAWLRMPGAERERLQPEFVEAEATWAETAAAFGTTLHALAQWHRLVRTPMDGDWRSRIAPDGREFDAPTEGELDPSLLPVVAEVLTAHTSTPDAGFAALWEGWGNLVGHLGMPSNPGLFGPSGGDDPHHQAMLGRSTHDPFNNVFRKPTWQEGLLPREVSEGPRLELPDRAYVLFGAEPRTFADPGWVNDAPWRDRPSEEQGFPPYAQSPNLIWPEDRAWAMVTEIEADSTIIAGSNELVHDLCTDDRIEALPIREGSSLTWDSDEVNR